MKIAYVEDDRDARQILSNRLKEDGHECDAFDTAEDLLKSIDRGSYDALIADIRLPGLSGVELIAKLREQRILTPCILITAFNSLEYARAALNANANYLLEKPFKYPMLLNVIRKVTSSALSVEYCVDRGLASLNLTKRELDIARLLLKGLANHEIAKMAQLSEKTVKQYITQIFQKAKVRSRAEFFSSIFPV